MNRYLDWFEQAKIDLEKAKLDLTNGFYEWACFTSQQSGEKSVKALILKFGFTPWGHSITALLKLISDKIRIPKEIIECGQLLDSYYIPTRYPNGFDSGKPADYYNERVAKEAIDAAGKILEFCKDYIFREKENNR